MNVILLVLVFIMFSIAAYESGFRRGWNKALALGVVIGRKQGKRAKVYK